MYHYKLMHEVAEDIATELKTADRALVLIAYLSIEYGFYIFPLKRSEITFFLDDDFLTAEKKKSNVSRVITLQEAKELHLHPNCQNTKSVEQILYRFKKLKIEKDYKPPHSWVNIPQYPTWFTDNLWLLNNQEHSFTKRLLNAMHNILGDISLNDDQSAPMETTRKYLMGNESANACRFQYQAAVSALEKLTGTDAYHAEKVMNAFKKEYENYLPFLNKKELV